MSNKDAVADWDDEKEGEWVQWPGNPAAICCNSRGRNKQETADRDRDIEELGLSNAPYRLSAMLVEVMLVSPTECGGVI